MAIIAQTQHQSSGQYDQTACGLTGLSSRPDLHPSSELLRAPLQHELAHARSIRGALHRFHDGADYGTGALHLVLANFVKDIRLRS